MVAIKECLSFHSAFFTGLFIFRMQRNAKEVSIYHTTLIYMRHVLPVVVIWINMRFFIYIKRNMIMVWGKHFFQTFGNAFLIITLMLSSNKQNIELTLLVHCVVTFLIFKITRYEQSRNYWGMLVLLANRKTGLCIDWANQMSLFIDQ